MDFYIGAFQQLGACSYCFHAQSDERISGSILINQIKPHLDAGESILADRVLVHSEINQGHGNMLWQVPSLDKLQEQVDIYLAGQIDVIGAKL